MTKTITILIGNSDDKLTQKEWSLYVDEVDHAIRVKVYSNSEHSLHLTGAPETSSPYQNYCWVAVLTEPAIEELKETLSKIRKEYRQDGVAVVTGTSETI